jgi:hypothetical protein
MPLVFPPALGLRWQPTPPPKLEELLAPPKRVTPRRRGSTEPQQSVPIAAPAEPTRLTTTTARPQTARRTADRPSPNKVVVDIVRRNPTFLATASSLSPSCAAQNELIASRYLVRLNKTVRHAHSDQLTAQAEILKSINDDVIGVEMEQMLRRLNRKQPMTDAARHQQQTQDKQGEMGGSLEEGPGAVKVPIIPRVPLSAASHGSTALRDQLSPRPPSARKPTLNDEEKRERWRQEIKQHPALTLSARKRFAQRREEVRQRHLLLQKAEQARLLELEKCLTTV